MVVDKNEQVAYYIDMNHVLLFAFAAALTIGLLNGLAKIRAVRKNPSLGVKQSKNIFQFMFNDRY